MADVDYVHEQFGTFMVAFVSISGVVLLVLLASAGLLVAAAISVLICLILVAFLFRLRVEVTPRQLRLTFGVGVVTKRFEVAEIAAAYPVRNKWYYGWGIRLTPKGWLFNVSGLDAVEIEMKSGKHYRIGTDEPEVLSAALQRAIA